MLLVNRTTVGGATPAWVAKRTGKRLPEEDAIIWGRMVLGTTRDSVDTVVTVGDRTYRMIDTAGIRRKGKTEHMAEKMSVVMARKNIVRCDVALLVIDAVDPPP